METHINRSELIKLLTKIENGKIEDSELRLIYSSVPGICIGITGMPGAGKSCLISCLLEYCKKDNIRTGVIALDPVSPKSGGSILADRVRMQRFAGVDDIFIRSITYDNITKDIRSIVSNSIRALSAGGFERILVETVGVGQSELSVKNFSDLVVVVIPSDYGDKMQTIKAGLLEIADIIVVNKSDIESSKKVFAQFEDYFTKKELLFSVSAKNNENINLLYKKINQSIENLRYDNTIELRRRERIRDELSADIYNLFEKEFLNKIEQNELKEGVEKVLKDNQPPALIAREIINTYFSIDNK